MTKFKNKLILSLSLALLVVGIFFILKNNSWEIDGGEKEDETQENISPLSGLSCDNYQRRPLAVVLANDPVTRPLTGLSEADMVIEMPVITNSITRIIAIFQCYDSDEIGSLRSARHDFIYLTMGLDAIMAHWGGSHFALDLLNNGVMDNIDALKNPYNSFYRKNSIPQPHNGFTSISRLISAAEKLGYRTENKFEGYDFSQKDQNQIDQGKVLKIDYSYPYNVSYQYDPEINSYLRYRTNLKEIDKGNGKQIQAKNIVLMESFSKQIQGPDYNDLDLEGTGDCQIYQNGIVLNCTWQKSEKNPTSKLKFLNENGQEISFVPGQTWIEIIEPSQEISWE